MVSRGRIVSPVTIRHRLGRLMGERGLTPAEVARMAGLSHRTVLDLYRGKATRIELKTLDALCSSLKVTPGDLLEYVPTEPPRPD